MSSYESLVQLAQSTDETIRKNAFNELVLRFQNMAFARAYAMLGDIHLAEDVMQETFITAYDRIYQLQNPTAFPGWLKRIVLTHCDRLTRGIRPTLESIDTHYDIASTDTSPEDSIEEMEIHAHIQLALAALPEHERTVTEGFYIKGESQRELAERLQVPVTTVKKRLQYARQHLRGLFGELNAAMDQAISDVLTKRQPQQQAVPIYTNRAQRTMPDQDPS